MNYVLDTNVISDLLRRNDEVYLHVSSHLDHGNRLILCQPVYFEVWRGLLWRNATTQQQLLANEFRPMFEWSELIDSDWERAAVFWQETVRLGRRLSDVDLLIAAVTVRLDAVLVTADNDFDVLPVKRENWRVANRR
jgi:tRNA(fMet)-specific endonuclease VapC